MCRSKICRTRFLSLLHYLDKEEVEWSIILFISLAFLLIGTECPGSILIFSRFWIRLSSIMGLLFNGFLILSVFESIFSIFLGVLSWTRLGDVNIVVVLLLLADFFLGLGTLLNSFSSEKYKRKIYRLKTIPRIFCQNCF